MSIRFIHSINLESLFPLFDKSLRAERQKLSPQTPQAVVVGNLDTQAWLTQSFLEQDGILMMVDFPFLESAISSFASRLERGINPTKTESWFSAIPDREATSTPLSRAELELILLGLLKDEKNRALFEALGYGAAHLNASRQVALAMHWAKRLHEAVLHIPQTLADVITTTRKTQNAAEKLWQKVFSQMTASKRPFYSFDPTLPARIAAAQQIESTNTSTLRLFGMPLLSEFHTRTLVSMAKHIPVEIYSLDFSLYADAKNPLLSLVGQKAQVFKTLVEDLCSELKLPLEDVGVSAERKPKRALEVHRYPSLWRAAELFGDTIHSALSQDGLLRQNHFSVVLTDAANQFAPFERALGMRSLKVFSRTHFFEAPSPLVELWQLLSQAAAGINRDLLLRYARNPIVEASHGKEEIELNLALLQKLHAYRDDYEGAQSIFLLDEGLGRLLRSAIVSNEVGLPPATPIDTVEAAQATEKLTAFLRPLRIAHKILAEKKGTALAQAMRDIQKEIAPTGDEMSVLSRWFEKMATLPGFETLSFTDAVALLARSLPRASLAQQASQEGVTFSPLVAACFTKRIQGLFDLSEDIEKSADDGPLLFETIKDSATRLTVHERVAFELVTALSSNVERLIFAIAEFDAVTGAQKYPATHLAQIEDAALSVGRTYAEKREFPTTLLGATASGIPIASSADVATVNALRLTNSPPKDSLSTFLIPKNRHENSREYQSVKDLKAFLQNPALYRLRNFMPGIEAEFAFRNDEPKISLGDSGRLTFAADYLKSSLLDVNERTILSPIEFVQWQRASALSPPDGFDTTKEFLTPQNVQALENLAAGLSQQYKLVEFVFHQAIKKSCSVDETSRLTRHYMPAVSVGDRPVTGSSGIFLYDATAGVLVSFRRPYQSKVQNAVESSLIGMLLTLSQWKNLPNQIFVGELNTDTKAKSPIEALDLKTNAAFALFDAKDATKYLANLLQALLSDEIIFYDHSLIESPVFDKWADKERSEAFETMQKNGEKFLSGESAMAQKFYSLEVDEQSVDFFERFIQPIARQKV